MTKRGGRFVCVIAAAFPDSQGGDFFRICGGVDRKERVKGANGFARPYFYFQGHERTFAEMFDKGKRPSQPQGRGAWKGFMTFLKGFIRKINIIILFFS